MQITITRSDFYNAGRLLKSVRELLPDATINGNRLTVPPGAAETLGAELDRIGGYHDAASRDHRPRLQRVLAAILEAAP
jgi:hypothetical protein